MAFDYKNLISHIDLDRNLGSIQFFEFLGIEDEKMQEFRKDVESSNDSIETHLIKSVSYKEALALKLKKSGTMFTETWREFLVEEQKTFGGSKIFYINDDCSRILLLSVPNEIKNKLNMVITRVNKINEKINRINSKIRKDNIEVYTERIKSKDPLNEKDDIINFINQNLRV
ncbi:MAG TPA: hypothetical protein VI564_03125 [Candidatus Nanoarchaeia archaeon]|nr:hypothetical protein [Candidatus Nanoarchaeia archaeon]